jgi:hypothetical protein
MKRNRLKLGVTAIAGVFSFLGAANTAFAHGGMHIEIQETDPRTITDLRIYVDYWIGNQRFSDYEDIPNKSQCLLELNNSGSANFLATSSCHPPFPQYYPNLFVEIEKEDPRDYSQVLITVTFKVDGYLHYDYEYVDPAAEAVSLKLDGRGGQWYGFPGWYAGDFLHL